MEYRCGDGYSPGSTIDVTIMNPESLSSTETGVDPEIRSWKNHLSKWARRKKAVGVVYFTKKWKVETLQRGLGIGSFKPRLIGCNFNTHLLAERSVFYFYLFIYLFFFWIITVFRTYGVKTYLMAPMSSLDSPTFFSVFPSIVCTCEDDPAT